MTPTVLVDALAIIRPIWHGSHRSVAAWARVLEHLRDTFGARPEIALDSPGPGWRHALFPAYKADRPGRPEGYDAFVERCLRWAYERGHSIWIADGHEADDVLATLALHSAGAVAIVTGDKDLLQLEDARVRVWWRGSWQAAETRLGVPPAQAADLLALAGDSTDGIPGVPGIGTTRARALLAQHGSLEGVLAAASAGQVPQSKTRAALVEHADAARLYRRLVGLRLDAPVRSWTPADARPPAAPEPTAPAAHGATPAPADVAAAPAPRPGPAVPAPPIQLLAPLGRRPLTRDEAAAVARALRERLGSRCEVVVQDRCCVAIRAYGSCLRTEHMIAASGETPVDVAARMAEGITARLHMIEPRTPAVTTTGEGEAA